MDILKNIENNKIIYNNKEISIIFDNNEILWFNANDVSVILEYKYNKDGVHSIVDKEHKTQLFEIKTDAIVNKHRNSLYLNEEGLKIALKRSRKEIAKQLSYWCFNCVIPLIKKFEYNKIKNNIQKEYQTLQNNLEYLEKKNTIFKNNIQKNNLNYKNAIICITENINEEIYYNIYIITDENIINVINKKMIYNKQKIIYKKEICYPHHFELCVKQKLFNNMINYENDVELYSCNIEEINECINEYSMNFSKIILNNIKNNENIYNENILNKINNNVENIINNNIEKLKLTLDNTNYLEINNKYTEKINNLPEIKLHNNYIL